MSIWEFGKSYEAASRALLLSEAFLVGPPGGSPEPFSGVPFAAQFNIYGVGLLTHASISPNVVPYITMDHSELGKDLKPFPAVHPLLRVPMAVHAVRTAFGIREDIRFPFERGFWEGVQVVGIPEPELYVNLGDTITGSRTGTVGTQIHWGTNTQGFLTAGHVAQRVRNAVIWAKQTVGKVVFVEDPAGHGKQIEADVGVVQLSSGYTMKSTITGTMVVNPADDVDVWKSPYPMATVDIVGKNSWFYIKKSNGTYGDVFQSGTGVTSPGDSGAAVVHHQNPHKVIGHVIGGSGATTSFIQDIHYQLAALRRDASLSNARI